MPFDIRDPLLDEEGYVDEAAVERYQRELVRLFKASAEAHELRQQGIQLEWAALMLEFALNDLDLTPPRMDEDDLLTILLDYFPDKSHMDVRDIDVVLTELRAFWAFVRREYQLRNARACLRILNRRTAEHMARAIEGSELDLDYDEDLELPRWLEFLLNTGFALWTRLQKWFGRQKKT